MKVILVIAFCVSATFAFLRDFDDVAIRCNAEVCKSENGCVCASVRPPIAGIIPQFVTVTFDDSVTKANYEQYLVPLLFDRVNANGMPIGATFYVPHEYTDYECVNNLYNKGFEIADFSISKNALTSYWDKADAQQLTLEFSGQREIIAKFANLPIESIVGARTPHFWLADNRTFEAYKLSSLHYDHSWTTHTAQPLFPYTLDYLSTQQCLIGNCPNASFGGFWVTPIINILGQNGKECNILVACEISGTAEEISEWLKGQFHKTYNGNRAPLSVLVNAAWFTFTENSFEGLKLFLDYLGTLSEVFLVSKSEVLKWAKNPVTLAEYQYKNEERNAECSRFVCPLKHGDTEVRYMVSCVPCPALYPWLGNPKGEASSI